MKLSNFDYNLPKELIAQIPTEPRDHSRLLVLGKKNGGIKHKKFFNIIDYLKKGDILVMNNSKVFPARLIGQKEGTGGRVEVFLLAPCLHRANVNIKWNCLIGGLRGRVGVKIKFLNGLECVVLKSNQNKTWEVEFNMSYFEMMKIVDEIGKVPLPPYIKNENERNKERYQTVYAKENKIGSVAAPTAGLHFTADLIDKIRDIGVEVLYVTLHVGLGTFGSVGAEDITKHEMHAEYVEVDEQVAKRIENAKKEKRKIIAVGTTSARTLEAVYRQNNLSTAYAGLVNIFIYPGYNFKVVDSLVTNFHLPRSTLLMLVSALAGTDSIKKAYKEAVDEKYGFYSYGDVMFID